jgi:hypothetical protein
MESAPLFGLDASRALWPTDVPQGRRLAAPVVAYSPSPALYSPSPAGYSPSPYAYSPTPYAYSPAAPGRRCGAPGARVCACWPCFACRAANYLHLSRA